MEIGDMSKYLESIYSSAAVLYDEYMKRYNTALPELELQMGDRVLHVVITVTDK